MNDAATTMHPEIERRFLVRSFPTEFRAKAQAQWMHQGYLLTGKLQVRVRLQIGAPFYIPPESLEDALRTPPDPSSEGWMAYVGIKTREANADWKGQKEWQDGMPVAMAWRIFVHIQEQNPSPLPAPWLSKIHYQVGRYELHIFTKSQLRDLAILEIELAHADEHIELPEGFHCIEITDDDRFSNQSLSQLSREEFLTLAGELDLYKSHEHLDEKRNV